MRGCVMQGRTVVSGCKAVVTASVSDRAYRTVSPSTTVRRTTPARRLLSRPSRHHPSTTMTVPPAEVLATTRAAVVSSSSPAQTRPRSRRRPSRPGSGSVAPLHAPSSCGSRVAPGRGCHGGQLGRLAGTVRAAGRPVKTESRFERTAVPVSSVRYQPASCCTPARNIFIL